MPVIFNRSSKSTPPSGSLWHWSGPHAVVPVGARLSCVIVSPVRFQNLVTPRSAACAVVVAVTQRTSVYIRCLFIMLARSPMVMPLRHLATIAALCCPLFATSGHAEDNGYATVVRAEYVFACMATNGGT